MATIIDEHQQWADIGGKPVTDGSLFIGIAGSDPVANPKFIFSDSGLTVPAANPQTLNSLGQSPVKLYIDGEYSIQVNDVNAVQVYQSLSAGTVSGGLSIIGLDTVSGGDTIIASGDIFSYVDKSLYTFTVAQVNTGPVTLNIDGVGAKSVLKNNDEQLDSGDFAADQNVIVSYNATSDTFQHVDQKTNLLESGGAMTGTLSLSKGADIASATALTLGSDGNYFDVTGTTTITSIGTAGIGTVIRLHFDAILTLTHNAADLILPGVANITTAVGDEAEFVEYASGDWRCTKYQRAAIKPRSEPFISPEQTVTSAAQLIIPHGLGVKPTSVSAYLVCKVIDVGFSVGDELEINPGVTSDTASAARGMNMRFNATNIVVRFGDATNVFPVLNDTTGAAAVITNTSWRLVVRASE